MGELSSLVQLSLDRFGFNRSNLTRHTCVSLTSPGVTQDQKPHKQSCSSVPYSHGALVCVAAVRAGAVRVFVRVQRESDRDQVLYESERERRGGGDAPRREANDAGKGRDRSWRAVKRK